MFEDIKRGDKIAIIEDCGIKSWNTMYFKRSFVVHIEVERITKTQFIAGGMRFKKDSGREICSGYGGEVARKTTGTHSDWSGKYDLSKDQSKEFNVYREKVSDANKLIEREHGCFDMLRCKTLEGVFAASELLKKLQEIAPCKTRG